MAAGERPGDGIHSLDRAPREMRFARMRQCRISDRYADGGCDGLQTLLARRSAIGVEDSHR